MKWTLPSDHWSGGQTLRRPRLLSGDQRNAGSQNCLLVVFILLLCMAQPLGRNHFYLRYGFW